MIVSNDKGITDLIVLNTFEKLISNRAEQLRCTPVFLEEERENLEMEIESYKRHLRKIREAQE